MSSERQVPLDTGVCEMDLIDPISIDNLPSALFD